MELIKTEFKDLIIIKHDVYNDKRGYFKEKIKYELLENITNQKLNFCQENSAESYLNVLRGLHYQKTPFQQSKLISIEYGTILDIAVDIRYESDTYGKYFSYKLSSKNHESLFIPKGFAHGYLTLSKSAKISYVVDNFYNPKTESGIPYDDKYLNIDWSISKEKIIISEKDKHHPDFIWLK